jgi:hypothetical protein
MYRLINYLDNGDTDEEQELVTYMVRRSATGGVGGGYPPPALENLVTAFSDFGRKYL